MLKKTERKNVLLAVVFVVTSTLMLLNVIPEEWRGYILCFEVGVVVGRWLLGK